MDIIKDIPAFIGSVISYFWWFVPGIVFEIEPMIGRIWSDYDTKVKHKFNPTQRKKFAHWILVAGFITACYLAFHNEKSEREKIETEYQSYKNETSSSEIMKELDALKKENLSIKDEMHQWPKETAPELKTLSRTYDKEGEYDIVKIQVEVISKYSPNVLLLDIQAFDMEDANVNPVGKSIMITGESRISPTQKLVSIKNPYGRYEVIIKTKEPYSATLTYRFK